MPIVPKALVITARGAAKRFRGRIAPDRGWQGVSLVGWESRCNQSLDLLFELTGRTGKHFFHLRLKGRKYADHGGSAVDFGKDGRT